MGLKKKKISLNTIVQKPLKYTRFYPLKGISKRVKSE